jgi:hypothetical protein
MFEFDFFQKEYEKMVFTVVRHQPGFDCWLQSPLQQSPRINGNFETSQSDYSKSRKT